MSFLSGVFVFYLHHHYRSCFLFFSISWMFWVLGFVGGLFWSLISLGIIPVTVTSIKEWKVYRSDVDCCTCPYCFSDFHVLHMSFEIQMTVSIIYIIIFVVTKLIVLYSFLNFLKFFISNMNKKLKLLYTHIWTFPIHFIRKLMFTVFTVSWNKDHFFNSFIEIQLTYHTIHPFEVCISMPLDCFSFMINSLYRTPHETRSGQWEVPGGLEAEEAVRRGVERGWFFVEKWNAREKRLPQMTFSGLPVQTWQLIEFTHNSQSFSSDC